MPEQKDKSIDLKITPPNYFLLALAIAFAVDYWIMPLNIFSTHFDSRGAGLIILGLGVILLVWAGQTLARHGVDPRFKPVAALATTGAYAVSRNPIYVAFSLVYLGIAVFFNTLWPVLLLPAVLILLHYGVVAREEIYLEEIFGEEYKEYRAKVRRWF